MTCVRSRWLDVLKHTPVTQSWAERQTSSAHGRGVPDCPTIRPAHAFIHPACPHTAYTRTHTVLASLAGNRKISEHLDCLRCLNPTRPNTLTCPFTLGFITRPNGLPIILTSYPASLLNRLMQGRLQLPICPPQLAHIWSGLPSSESKDIFSKRQTRFSVRFTMGLAGRKDKHISTLSLSLSLPYLRWSCLVLFCNFTYFEHVALNVFEGHQNMTCLEMHRNLGCHKFLFINAINCYCRF